MSQFKRPDKPFAEIFKGVRPGVIDKRFVTVMKSGSDGEGVMGATVSVQRPTPSQLAKINKFTRSEKTADEVAVIPTYACNDLVDRDNDAFRTSTVKEMHALTGALDPVGKSFMVGHDYSKLPVGRIFDKHVVREDGVTHLKLDSYIPNTEANKTYLENVDYGVYWAVSVGVMLERGVCEVGKPHQFGGGWFGGYVCEKGHIKGLYYDPESDEEDAWGWPIPADENTAGAIQCIRFFEGAKDFYELSQVYLGAQYFAQLSDKNPELAGVIKAASAGTERRFFNLGGVDLQSLPLTHDKRVLDALRTHKAKVEDGVLSWVQEGIKWTFDPEGESEPMALGEVNEESEEEESEEKPSDEETDETSEEEEESDGSSDEEESSEEEEEAEEGSESTERMFIQDLVHRLNLPPDVVAAAGGDNENFLNLLERHYQAREAEMEELRSKAALGTAYVEEIKSQTVSWYIRANQGDKPVSVNRLEKTLDALGDDAEGILHLLEGYKATAQARFPSVAGGGMRRSSVNTIPTDEHGLETRRGEGLPSILTEGDQQRVQRIHG